MDTVEFLADKVPLLKGFSAETLRRLVSESRTVSFEKHEVVAHQGAAVTHVGIVMRGDLSISAAGTCGSVEVLGRLKPGDTLGDASLMTGDVMLADIVAESLAEVLLIPVSLFRSVVMTDLNAIRHLSRTLAQRTQILMTDQAKVDAALQRGTDPYGLSLKAEQPERILVINCGSSSLKYSFYDTEKETRFARGVVERIGVQGTRLTHYSPAGEVVVEIPGGDFPAAFKGIIDALTAPGTGVIRRVSEVTVVAHRVVHGGERFNGAALITPEVMQHLEATTPLAPLHNPVNLAGIREMKRLFPAVPHVAVFDTAFHHTLPPYAYLYGLPYDLYEQQRVRRYGFHGSSHQYVALRTSQHLKRRPNELRIISCHLGNGSSLCAIDHGRSRDTTMGFTPIEGLMMGTRLGDIDPGIITFLQRTQGLTGDQCDELLNKRSGLLGVSGVSSDMREVLAAADGGDHRALLAVKTYCYRVRKFIGAYIAAMGGADAIVFTAGVGQGSSVVRALSLQGLGFMGVQLDEDLNRAASGREIATISSAASAVQVLVVPTDEERMIARETLRALGGSHIAAIAESRAKEPVLVEVSAHHVHLSQKDVEALFGPGHTLTKVSDLSQPGQFACKEQVTLVGPKGRIERVRVLGPTRANTQVEIAMTEQFKLGIHPPIRESGDIEGTPGCTLEGSAGAVTIERGVICAARHIHMSPEDALKYGVHDRSSVRVRIAGERELVFGDVLIRVDPNFALAMHIDTDEANAANVQTGAEGFIEEIQN